MWCILTHSVVLRLQRRKKKKSARSTQLFKKKRKCIIAHSKIVCGKSDCEAAGSALRMNKKNSVSETENVNEKGKTSSGRGRSKMLLVRGRQNPNEIVRERRRGRGSARERRKGSGSVKSSARGRRKESANEIRIETVIGAGTGKRTGIEREKGIARRAETRKRNMIQRVTAKTRRFLQIVIGRKKGRRCFEGRGKTSTLHFHPGFGTTASYSFCTFTKSLIVNIHSQLTRA
jgi:hypothetical protein